MTPEKIINLRGVEGVARGEDARLSQKGTWYATRNMWARNPGILAKRPGSILILDGRVPSLTNGLSVSGVVLPVPGAVADIPTAVLTTGIAQVQIPATVISQVVISYPANLLGTGGIRPKVNV